MGTSRLNAFFDGVVAIVITIMVLELEVPHGDSILTLTPLVPVVFSYLLSFIYLGIYWNNHHHMMHTVKKVTGSMLWANLHLIFWLSLVPFATRWMSESYFASVPVAAYGLALLMAAIAYRALQQRIIVSQGENSLLKRAIGNDWKGKLSLILHIAAISLAFVVPRISVAIYVSIALVWVVPDRRVERAMSGRRTSPPVGSK